MDRLTHIDAEGRARMVDVTEKPRTERMARAHARVTMRPETLELVRAGSMKKGDVLAVAQLAGIMAAKRTSELIPLCHPIRITACDVGFSFIDEGIAIESCVRCTGETGVEMEALTAASIAALTIYDMCKAVQRDMEIDQIFLLEKSGGASGWMLRDDI